jgi:3-oxoacyl-[acyl-carrier-protein] synthase-1
VFTLGQQVRALSQHSGRWRVTTAGGSDIDARAVMIAGGSGAFGPNRPPLPGIGGYEGKSVFYAIGRREDFRGKRVVIAGGGGVVVLEELEHAQARGAKIYAEIIGYGATSDGYDMVQPSGEGAVRCMRQAMTTVDAPIDYINTHGTSTPVGDIAELDAMREVFNGNVPPFSSSKSLCGHSLGAAGVQEAIHCLLMLEHDFMAGSANISELDPKAEGLPVLLESKENAGLHTVMSNNFGFGGTNASIVFQRYGMS